MLLNETPSVVRRALASVLLDRLAEAAPTESGLPGQLVHLDGMARLDYHLGLLDALSALGVVELTADSLAVRVVSPAAGWALCLINDLLNASAPLVADWHAAGLTPAEQLHHPFGRGPDCLAALDQRRHEVLPGAAPVREVKAAVGLLARRDKAGELHFLLVYDDDAHAWQLPGGRRDHDDVTLHDTLMRELGEEIGWDVLRGSDNLLLHELPHVTETRQSPTFGLYTRTTFAPFLVLLRRELSLQDTGVRWLSLKELLAGRTADGMTVAAEPLLRLLDHPNLDLEGLLHKLEAQLVGVRTETDYNETH